MSKIIIQIQGGLVQDTFISGRGKLTETIVVNEDVEDADSNDPKITSVRLGRSKTYEACIHATDINRLPKGSDVDRIIKQWEKDNN